MNRKDFIQLFAGILGSLRIPGVIEEPASAAPSQAGTGSGQVLDDSYLVKGLTGMARAEGWFSAHWGAAVLAGYYLCRENPLDAATVAAIRKQLDAMIHLRGSQFVPFPAAAAVDEKLIERVPGALPPAIQDGLRAHGHAVIFVSLSTRALRDAPHMAHPAILDGLCALSRQISRIAPQKPLHSEPFHYADTQAMIDATFDSLARFEGLLGRPSIRRPNFTHMTTHTEALMNLEMMGYPDLARAGHVGHRIHIGAPVPEVDPATKPSADRATLKAVMSQRFWNDQENQDHWSGAWDAADNRNGSWVAAGHLFKVLYSYHRLIRHVRDPDKVKRCSKILLERYMNPNVQGG